MRSTFIILFFTSFCFSQIGSVSGKVASDGLGLPGANVSLIGSDLGAVTDSLESYYLTGIPTGKYLLRVDYIGYETQTKEIYITLYDLDEKDETGSVLVDKMGIDVELEESIDILKGNSLTNVNFNLITSAFGLDLGLSCPQTKSAQPTNNINPNAQYINFLYFITIYPSC